MAPTATATAAILIVLGDDLLREVLVRLPTPEDLVRAAAACRPFLRAARNPSLLRQFRRLHPSSCSRLLGCLTLRPGPLRAAPEFLTSSSTSTAGLAHAGAFDLSFLPNGGWLGGDSTWQLLDCRNGRILVSNVDSQQLGVTDPLSRCYTALPAPPTERGAVVGWGLVADHGDSSVFRVVCISRDAAASRELRALILSSSSGNLSWADVAGISCQPDLAAGSSRAMQADRSLYWKLEGGERMLAFSTATMAFSLLDLPPSLHELSFDVIEKGAEDRNVLHLLTMTSFCVEVWAGTGTGDCNGGGLQWMRVDRSVRFHKFLREMFKPSVESYPRKPEIIVVAANVVFVHQWDNVFSIDLETMKVRVLSKEGCSSLLIYPYTIAWPPSFLDPGVQGM